LGIEHAKNDTQVWLRDSPDEGFLSPF
jgi:hypothetical protein